MFYFLHEFIEFNRVHFRIFRAKVWKILIFEWILLLEIQTNCKNWVCKEIGKVLGQKMMDEIDCFVPMSKNSFGEEFLQYLCCWCCWKLAIPIFRVLHHGHIVT